MIAIIDYGMGNLHSVYNALQAIGAQAVITSDPAQLTAAEGIILPGVGSFGAGMAELRARGLDTLPWHVLLPAPIWFAWPCHPFLLSISPQIRAGHSGLLRARRCVRPPKSSPACSVALALRLLQAASMWYLGF